MTEKLSYKTQIMHLRNQIFATFKKYFEKNQPERLIEAVDNILTEAIEEKPDPVGYLNPVNRYGSSVTIDSADYYHHSFWCYDCSKPISRDCEIADDAIPVTERQLRGREQKCKVCGKIVSSSDTKEKDVF